MGHLDEFSRWPVRRFIETGVGEGKTLAAASLVYEQCISIELYEPRYCAAVEQFAKYPNVRLYLGNSPDILKTVIDPSVSTLFWLDAHYVPGDAVIVDGHGLCPILEELAIIQSLTWEQKPVILIDDWCTFMTERHGWPKLKELDDLMGRPHVRYPELPGCDVFGYV
jgi:hypothetical protein